MHFKRATRQRDSEAAILPLTNVVFLLLIFFLLAGRIVEPEAFSITPPESVSRTALEARAIRVELAPNGQLAVAGEPVARDALAATLVEQRGDRDVPVELKADGAERATRVVAVMQILHEAGVQRLRLVTTGKNSR